MKNILEILNKRFYHAGIRILDDAVGSLSYVEKVVFWILVTLLILSALSIFSKINDSILVEVEAHGGSFTEGIFGAPRFINPILALSDADRDLVSLVYSGLLKATPDGGVTPDLAESYSVSEDGLVYEFTIREGAQFHDGAPVTADDVIFTIKKALDPGLKSARRANWDGVRIERVDERTLRFILTRPYAPFLQNTTMGVLPRHVWEKVGSEQFPFNETNLFPIGSGPYMVRSLSKDSSGVPGVYKLSSFKNYALGKPYIDKITLRFYRSEEEMVSAFNRGRIDAMNSVAPEQIKSIHTERIERSPLSRIFAVFFNQDNAQIFSNAEVRKALDLAVDKERIVEQVLAGYGTIIDGPVPPQSIEEGMSEEPQTHNPTSKNIEEAKNVLERNGWNFDEEEGVWKSEKKGSLSFSLATSNVPELKAVAEIVKESWEELGAHVDVQVFETGNLNQNVIRPREYDALLFGEVVGRELDLFAFWHSSQRNDPGLNIALYANITADALLEKGRTLLNTKERDKTYRSFEKEVQKDIPAVFLYAPDFVYIIPKNIQGLNLGVITTAGERFLNVHEWYIQTDKVWTLFAK